ncbi:hypothetical protein K466DRAFT_232357 [Polyporus arcularius HHB13444]|uniref:Uncharacterized protein n=1 Tax=Polyporus arcularius HHB13444 TaxID=1314778 RepID=A0A5C3PSC5_9APHY|nr:hypothetical protein K466DRAFT_232357 [Polyporus arcularius HHB13444]
MQRSRRKGAPRRVHDQIRHHEPRPAFTESLATVLDLPTAVDDGVHGTLLLDGKRNRCNSCGDMSHTALSNAREQRHDASLHPNALSFSLLPLGLVPFLSKSWSGRTAGSSINVLSPSCVAAVPPKSPKCRTARSTPVHSHLRMSLGSEDCHINELRDL